jgi:hypothetical protein
MNMFQDAGMEVEYIELALMADRSVHLVPPTVQVFVGYQGHGINLPQQPQLSVL